MLSSSRTAQKACCSRWWVLVVALCSFACCLCWFCVNVDVAVPFVSCRRSKGKVGRESTPPMVMAMQADATVQRVGFYHGKRCPRRWRGSLRRRDHLFVGVQMHSWTRLHRQSAHQAHGGLELFRLAGPRTNWLPATSEMLSTPLRLDALSQDRVAETGRNGRGGRRWDEKEQRIRG